MTIFTRLVGLNVEEAFYELHCFSTYSGVRLPTYLEYAFVEYVITYLDYSLELSTSFWSSRGFSTFLESKGFIDVPEINLKDERLYDALLQRLGFTLYGIVFKANLFRTEGDSFPYLVKAVTRHQVILEADY